MWTSRPLAAHRIRERESKLALYEEFIAKLEVGPFLGARAEPSLPDLAAYPQFALYYSVAFRGGDDILGYPKLMEWLNRMRPYLEGAPELLPERVRARPLP